MNISPDQMLAYSGCALELKAETGLDAPMPSPDYLEKLRGTSSP
jgi:hypothetical protein